MEKKLMSDMTVSTVVSKKQHSISDPYTAYGGYLVALTLFTIDGSCRQLVFQSRRELVQTH